MSKFGRREFTFEVDGHEYIGRATFQALERFQDRVGCKLLDWLVRAGVHDVSDRELAAFIYFAVKEVSGKESPSYNEVGEAVLDAGLLPALKKVIPVLEAIVQGSEGLDDDEDTEKKE